MLKKRRQMTQSQAYHSGKSPERGWLWDSSYYRVVLDKLSGAVLGYAMFQTNVIDIYDRQGKSLGYFGRSEPSAATWFQPGDFLAGPIASWAGLGESTAARGIQVAIESEVADEAVSGGVVNALVGTGSREQFRRQILAAIIPENPES